MFVSYRRSAPVWVTVALFTAIGCEPSSPPAKTPSAAAPSTAPVDPHDVPLTAAEITKLREDVAKFPDAVARIKSYRETIMAETKDGLPANPFKAHRALDELDRVLEWLPEIASKSVAKENWEAVTTASQELRELFNKVHTNLDSKQAPDYASVAAGIDERVGKLEGLAPDK